MKPPFSTFHFKGYRLDKAHSTVYFDYGIEFEDRNPLHFTETIVLPSLPTGVSAEFLKRFLEPLHLMLGISYYKLFCSPEIKLPFALSEDQAVFWNMVYRKGLGEFLYHNNLDPTDVATFPSGSNESPSSVVLGKQNGILLGIGGGKDSIVAAELLRDYDTTLFLVETQKPDPLSESISQRIGRQTLKIKRTLDPQLFGEHEGSYNGHIPISAIFAFLGLLSAALYGKEYVVVANEHSSNFGNVEYRGHTINHQWSKSVEFEALLQEYTRSFITKDITYFSLLRQFYEIRIVKMFAKYKKYFSTFSSCNRNFKVFKTRASSLWCGECPKCAFMFLLLAAFISKEELLDMFHKNMFEDESLVPLFKDLLGIGTIKPFDCVGTFEESRAALYLASQNFTNEIVVKTLLPLLKNSKIDLKHVLKTVHAPTLPTPFRFLGVESVCLLGYGAEGKVTHEYLKKYYPHLRIGVCDVSLGADYLVQQEEFDFAIKTPGISRNKVRIPYTTATNIFFSKVSNLVIGVTGSKGKSTTSSLIYEMLKAGGKKVRLVGNIGVPMLSVFLEPIDPQQIFVVELSSYMLEDIEYSPHIAVLLNLFPEHMDYHGDVDSYYRAKKNIFKYQQDGDYALKAPFNQNIPVKEELLTLKGSHNKQNIEAAIAVAKLLHIPDTAISSVIINFKPLPHRLELVGTFQEITFYDDAISTTPQSTIMAIKSLPRIDTIFLGGKDRGYNFEELEKTLRESSIRNIVLFPDSGSRMLKSHEGFNVFSTSSMKEAVEFAYKHTKKDSVCLLSCASPSYSLWKDFKHKGEEFKRYVSQQR